VNEKVLQFGNYLLVENSRLPAWVGIIDTPRAWDSLTVEVNAYTLERMFLYRRGPLEQKLTGSAGGIFEQLVNYINGQQQTLLQVGSIYNSAQREETLNPNTLDENLQQLQERSGEEYTFEPVITKGLLTIKADWQAKAGVITPLVLTSARSGGNVEVPSMTEDDEIVNDLLGYGDAPTWPSKPVKYTADTATIEKYGLRQNSENWRGVSHPATLEANNLEYLTKKKQPRKIFEITALNVGETFDYIRLGNKARLILQSLGFANSGVGTDTTVRILGMSYSPQLGRKIKLVLEEVI